MLGAPPDDALMRPTTERSVQDIVDGIDDCRWFNISAKIFWMVLMALTDSSKMLLMYEHMSVSTHHTYYVPIFLAVIFFFHTNIRRIFFPPYCVFIVEIFACSWTPLVHLSPDLVWSPCEGKVCRTHNIPDHTSTRRPGNICIFI
jgi:hypothetical protein